MPQLYPGIEYVEAILQICQNFGFKPKIAHESVHSNAVLRLVEAGLGISIEPVSSVRGVDMNIKIIDKKLTAKSDDDRFLVEKEKRRIKNL